MNGDFTVAFFSMEMVIPELPEPVRGANFKGGLGILAGDIAAGLKRAGIKGLAIIPLYRYRWIDGKEIFYGSSIPKVMDLNSLNIREINRGGTIVYGLEGQVFDRLYTDDRWQRIQQEIVFGKTAPLLLKKLGIKPDIVWFNESHTAVAAEAIKEDPYFKGTKILFTIHTPDPAGMERFSEQWFDELKIDRQKYYPIFVKDGCLDFTKAIMDLADAVNAVSDEHGSVTCEMFSSHAKKIIGIRNGSDRDLWLSPRLKEAGEHISSEKIRTIHQKDKQDFIDLAEAQTKITLDLHKPLIGLIRRITGYKNQYPILDPIIRAICADRNETVDTPCGCLKGLGMQVFCAGLASESDERCKGWVKSFKGWMEAPILRGKFVFLEDYYLGLLRKGASGCDIWLSCPWPKWEACGTSDQRTTINGNINVSTRSGGAKEYLQPIDLIAGTGNGLFIEPYDPFTVYQKLATLSDLYYAFCESGDNTWVKIMMNAFETGKSLDIVPMIEEYRKQIFVPLLNNGSR